MSPQLHAFVISIQTLSHVVHRLPIPVVLTDSSGFVVTASAPATAVLRIGEIAEDVHLDRQLSSLAPPRPTAQRSTVTCDTGEHHLVVLGSRAEAPAPADVSSLAGEIAHDFNNLLGVIINYATLAAADAPEGSQQSRDLAEVLSASRRAAEITDRLRRMSTARGTAI